MPKVFQAASKLQKTLIRFGIVFPPNVNTAEVMKPSKQSLNLPTPSVAAQRPAIRARVCLPVVILAMRRHRLNPPFLPQFARPAGRRRRPCHPQFATLVRTLCHAVPNWKNFKKSNRNNQLRFLCRGREGSVGARKRGIPCRKHGNPCRGTLGVGVFRDDV